MPAGRSSVYRPAGAYDFTGNTADKVMILVGMGKTDRTTRRRGDRAPGLYLPASTAPTEKPFADVKGRYRFPYCRAK